MIKKKRVLILCTGNAARSQMAEGLLRFDAGQTFEVESAGTHPSYVREAAIAVMRELGIDISNHRSKSVAEFTDQSFDYVITVCDNAKESCPIFPGRPVRIHWSIADPVFAPGDEQAKLTAFRKARDELRDRLRKFVETETS
jgi:arsenate reductase